jgi:AcrR family transcriptional regulator
VPLRKKGAAYHHGDLRRAVIDAAVTVIARDGTDGLSLRDLARRLGVSHQAPYRHFADKDALLAAIAADGFARLTRALRAGPDPSAAPIAGLIEAGVTYVKFALDAPAYYRVMFATAASPHGAAPRDRETDTSFAVLSYGIERGKAAGVLPDVPTRDIAVLAWTVVHGLAMLGIDGKLGPPAEALRVARAAITLQVETLARAASHPRPARRR